MDLDHLARQDPNFTILVPGGCNASCDFCFWNAANGRIRPPTDYIARLRDTLLSLPPAFKAISVSGGEPSISKHLMSVLEEVENVRTYRRFDRVVLTTNGSARNKLSDICHRGLIDFLNISRHAVSDEANAQIFKTKVLPTTRDLRELVQEIHAGSSVRVTMNCVVSPTLQPDEAQRLIDYAREVGFAAISLRKQASDVSPTPAELHYRELFPVQRETKCPVCRGATMNVNGFEVRWKGSVPEPSIDLGKTYETVFHPDGQLYADWDMKVPLEVAQLPSNARPSAARDELIARVVYNHPRPPEQAAYVGCGTSGC